jgi:hypothetical protein
MLGGNARARMRRTSPEPYLGLGCLVRIVTVFQALARLVLGLTFDSNRRLRSADGTSPIFRSTPSNHHEGGNDDGGAGGRWLLRRDDVGLVADRHGHGRGHDGAVTGGGVPRSEPTGMNDQLRGLATRLAPYLLVGLSILLAACQKTGGAPGY